MTSRVTSLSIAQRYLQAVRWTAPRIAAGTTGVAVEGYWLDKNSYFFLAERIEPSLGRIVSTPSIANLEADSVEEVVSLDTLTRLLSDHLGQPINLEALSCAEFHMPNRDRLGVSVGGRDYLLDLKQRRVISATVSWNTPALYSPDGRYACFVNGYDVWLKDLVTVAERQLTKDGAVHHCYGRKSEAGLSAVADRNRARPMGLWSSDSQWFLTHRIDERCLRELAMVQYAPPGGGREVLHTFKYVVPDDPLPVATYVAIHIASGDVITFEGLPALVTEPWAPWMHAWFSGKDTAWFLRFDRYYKQVDLVRLDLAQRTGRIVLSETVASGYIDLHHDMAGSPNVRTLGASDEIIWFSERDGWGHLYLYDATSGKLKNRITNGPWLVRDIVHVDEAKRRILFLAGGIDTEVDPARRSLCAVNLDGTGFEVLLTHDGDISVPRTEPCGLGQDRLFRPPYVLAGVSPSGHFGVVRYSSVSQGNWTEVTDLRTRRRGCVIASIRPANDEVPPRLFTALAADRVTRLHGVMFIPSNFDESQRYPLIDFMYPGPQTMLQPQSFRSVRVAAAMSLAELGVVVIEVDTRGIPSRSREFHQGGYPALLEPQLADHAAVVRQLCDQYHFIDGSRIGAMGVSAGGAAVARALFDYGEIFKVGVSVCGGHDSSFLVAGWSDKYRGPRNSQRWAEEANASAAHKLEGKLLLISGDMDEAVPVGQTLSLVDALVRANKDFDLLIVPNEGHGVLGNGYVQRRVWDYFVQNLLGKKPPPNFQLRFEPHELSRLEKYGNWEWL